MSAWTLYWILILDNVQTAMCVAFIISAIATAVVGSIGGILCGLGAGFGPEDRDAIRGRICLRFVAARWWILAVTGLAFALTPSTKQMAAIIIIPRIVNNETVQSEAHEIYDLAKEWMHQQVYPSTQPAK